MTNKLLSTTTKFAALLTMVTTHNYKTACYLFAAGIFLGCCSYTNKSGKIWLL